MCDKPPTQHLIPPAQHIFESVLYMVNLPTHHDVVIYFIGPWIYEMLLQMFGGVGEGGLSF